MIARTIEWPHRGRCVATGRLRRLGKDHSLRLAVLSALAVKFLSPERLDAVDETDNAAILAGVCVFPCLARLGQDGWVLGSLRRCGGRLLQDIDDGTGIPAKQIDDEHNHQTKATAPKRDCAPPAPAPTPTTTPVLNLGSI